MTDFGTMSVTRSLSISTRNSSSTSGISQFHSPYTGFYGGLPISEGDLASVPYPGYYRSHRHSDIHPHPVRTCNGQPGSPHIPTTPSGTCQQQKQQSCRSEWITLSKPFLLKLVEKLCQLSFENDSVSSLPSEVNGQKESTTNHVSTISGGSAAPADSSTTSSTGRSSHVQSNNNNNNNSKKMTSTGANERNARSKTRTTKFVRPFESSEERQRSDQESDCESIKVDSDNDEKSTSNSTSTAPPISGHSPFSTEPVSAEAAPNLAAALTSQGPPTESLKRERDIGDDSDTEHINVEDDDDEDDCVEMNVSTQLNFGNFHAVEKAKAENETKNSVDEKKKLYQIANHSHFTGKSLFDPVASSSAQIFSPLWSNSYFKLNYNLHHGSAFQSTVAAAFNSHAGYKELSQQESTKQSWAAFNKSLVYKMFDDVLDNDKSVFSSQVLSSATTSTLNNARFINNLNLHLANGFNKHLGVCGYELAYCGDKSGKGGDYATSSDRSQKRSSIISRNRKMRDTFARSRHQYLNRRNRTKNQVAGSSSNSSSFANKNPSDVVDDMESKEKENNSLCAESVPILGALLRCDDSKFYGSHHNHHHHHHQHHQQQQQQHSTSYNNNIHSTNKAADSQQQQQQQSTSFVTKSTTDKNSTTIIPKNPLISVNSLSKNGSKTDSNSMFEGWPKWIALDKSQVKSLVDSLVVSMMSGGEATQQSPSYPPNSSCDDTEMLVDPPVEHAATATQFLNSDDDTVDKMNNNNARENLNNDATNDKLPIGLDDDTDHHNHLSCNDSRDSETETNFSGDTQLDPSDADDNPRNSGDVSDDGTSSGKDGEKRKRSPSSHPSSPCPIKWKSNMLMRVKAEKRKPEK